MLFRIQVERSPMTKIVIFRPDEAQLPDEQKTYFAECSMGILGNDQTEFLEPEDLFMNGSNSVGLNINRLEARLGHSDLSRLIIPVETFKQFLLDQKDKQEG